MIATLCVSLFLVLMLTAAWTDLAGFRTVSYTHLTLPTKRIV